MASCLTRVRVWTPAVQVYAVLALWILVFANDLENTENEVEQARTEALRSHRSAMEDEATLSAADAVATLTPDDLARAADGGKPPKGFVLVMGAVRDPNTGVVLPISGLTQALPCSPSCVCWWDAAQRGAKPTSCLSNPTSCSKCWRWMQHGCLRRRSAWFGVWCLLLGTASKHCQPTHRLTCHACVSVGRGVVAVGYGTDGAHGCGTCAGIPDTGEVGAVLCQRDGDANKCGRVCQCVQGTAVGGRRARRACC